MKNKTVLKASPNRKCLKKQNALGKQSTFRGLLYVKSKNCDLFDLALAAGFSVAVKIVKGDGLDIFGGVFLCQRCAVDGDVGEYELFNRTRNVRIEDLLVIVLDRFWTDENEVGKREGVAVKRHAEVFKGDTSDLGADLNRTEFAAYGVACHIFVELIDGSCQVEIDVLKIDVVHASNVSFFGFTRCVGIYGSLLVHLEHLNAVHVTDDRVFQSAVHA